VPGTDERIARSIATGSREAAVRNHVRWCSVALTFALGCTPDLQVGRLGDLKLESGETLEDCRVAYRTFGRLNPARSNAVLVTPWLQGTSRQLARQIGRGKLVDSSRHFVIAVDALANGVSSSPSNSSRQPGRAFPRLSMRDVVESEFRLVTEVLHLPRLEAVVGVSMGGMQAFEWIAAHPEFVGRAVAISGSPRPSPADRSRWRAWVENVRAVPVWKRAAEALLQGSPRGILHELQLEPEDYAVQVGAMVSVDATTRLEGPVANAAAASRPVFVVVSKRDDAVDSAPALELARRRGAQVLELDGACGHAAASCEKATLWAAVAAFLDP
jgi:homoserine O-acetyltransferase